MSSLVGGTGIIGQDMVCGFSNGKYTTFEGTEIVAENCLKAKVKDLVVEGKTIQDTEDLSNIESVAEKERNLANYIIKAIGTSGERVVFDNKNCLKITSTFSRTIVLDDTSNYQIYINAYANNENNKAYSIGDFGETYISCGNKTWAEFRITKSLNKFSVYNYQNSEVYIDLDTLSLVRINNPYPIKIKINEESNQINLPIPLRSLPNGVCDTIEENKLVQRVGKVTFDGTKEINLYNASTYARFSINMPINAKAYSKRTAVYAKGYYFDAIMNGDRVIFSSAVEGANRLYIYNYDYKTVNDFKAYLTENPLEVYYELAEPVIHSLEIPQIQTAKGTNIITTENNIKPKLKLKVKVKK